MENQGLWKDLIVEEVRKARQSHAKKFGNNLDAIARDLKRYEEEEDRTVVSFPPKRHKAAKGAA